MPFSIVGSEEEVEIDGQPVRARIYPWGIVEVDNPKHSDFSRLRGALLGYAMSWPPLKTETDRALPVSTHLSDLKALTHDVLYETYRTEKLSRTVHNETQYVPVFSFYCADY